jgi:pyruvate/2-oxoglutarate dehydrogenase complex dihydrolipoamide acyltransferase (E2) component
MCKPTLEAARTLAAENIEAEIIDLRTLRPLDRDTILQSARRTGRVIAVEEGWPQCGIAAEIGALVAEEAFADLKAPFRRVTAKDTPLPYAANLEAQALPNAQTIVAAARKLVAQTVTATRAIETSSSSTPSAPRTAEPYQLQTEIDVTDLIERSKSENIDWGVLLDDAARDALLPIVERDVDIRIQNLVHGGITSAVAIAMSENTGILTFGGIERKPVVRGDHIAPASMMAVTIMVVSSRLPANIAAQALRSLKNRLESND